MTAGEVQGDGVKALPDPAPNFEQPEPKGRKLQMGHPQCVPASPPTMEACEPAPDGVQEPVGAGVEEQAELIGPEADGN